MPPPTIGLAGGIGAGKTTVGEILARLGCVVACSDREGRAALRDAGIRSVLRSWWGDAILDASGAVDRGALAGIVFEDPEEKNRLEGLVHPWIEARRQALFAAAPPGTPAVVIDAPLLFEAGIDRECDAVIFVDAPRPCRVARVSSRGWAKDELARREDFQLPLDDKRSKADHILRNDGDLSDLEAQVRATLSDIVESHRT